MRAYLVLELDVPDHDDVRATIAAVNPPTLPHFAGTLHVVVDPDALELEAWLDEPE